MLGKTQRETREKTKKNTLGVTPQTQKRKKQEK